MAAKQAILNLSNNPNVFFENKKGSTTFVNMFEVGIHKIKTGQELLITEGVGPCICIMLHGFVNDKAFMLMHHWPGFYHDHEDCYLSILEDLSERYQLEIDSLFNINDDSQSEEPIVINNVIIIGGQERELDANGDLIIKGTEREIDLLYSKMFVDILKKDFILSDNFYLECDAFKTKGNATLTIEMSSQGYRFDLYDEAASTFKLPSKL